MSAFVFTWQAWYTIAVVVVMFLVLSLTKLRADAGFLAAIIALYAAGVLDVNGAFGGFCSNSVLVVAAMFCVIAGLEQTGVLNWIVDHLMGTPKTLKGAMVRVMLPVAALSSLLSNTTVVALFVNVVKTWSKKLGISPSKLLIPLSYASGMGGICTLVGTPPNMIIAGMYADKTGIQMGIFTTTLCGLSCLVVGIISMLAMNKLLPDRKAPLSAAKESDFATTLKVPSSNPSIGKNIQEAITEANAINIPINIIGIRHFDDEIAVKQVDEEVIMGTDRMLVAGKVEDIQLFAHRMGFVNEFLESVVKVEEKKAYGWKTVASALVLLVAITLSALNVIPLLKACLLAAMCMVLLRCCTIEQSINAIDWSILIIFAGSVALGAAIEQTGLAEWAADALMKVAGTNPLVVLGCICFLATFITEFISNTAAGAVFCPIALSAAAATGANPITFCVALMISVSSSFATPIGSPTHMLVYLPGGYRFIDFLKVGLPMNVIILAANLIITPIVFPL